MMPSFNTASRRFTPEIVKKSKFCKQGGKLDYSRYSQVFFINLMLSLATLRGAIAHGVSRSIKFSQIFCVCFIVFLYMSAGCVSTIRT